MKVHIASSTKPFCLFLQVTFPSTASETKIDYYQEKINGRNISRHAKGLQQTSKHHEIH